MVEKCVVSQHVLLPHANQIQKRMLFLEAAPNEQILDQMYQVTELGNAVLLTKGGLLPIPSHLTYST